MPKKKYKAEEIINILRQVEILVSHIVLMFFGRGKSHKSQLEERGSVNKTYYCWRKEYGGMRTDQAQRLKELEQENSRLNRIVADLSLDSLIIKEAIKVK